MIRNVLLAAYRNFRKNKLYSIVSVIGLGLGITCCFAQYAILRHEYSYDSFHERAENLYRVVEHHTGDNGRSYSAYLPNPMGYTLDEELSGIDVIPVYGPLNDRLKIDENTFFDENSVVFSNDNFFKLFSFPIVSVTDLELLNEPGKVMLSVSTVKKYYANENPIGKVIVSGKDKKLEVIGVFEDFPFNSTIKCDLLVSQKTLREVFPGWLSNWGARWEGTTYLAKDPSAKIAAIERNINQITSTHLSEEDNLRNQYFLQPLSDVHHNELYAGPNYVLPRTPVYASIATVLLILIVSVLNFINLTTSQAIRRSKEVGVRKTLGSSKGQLVTQFVTETALIVTLACFVGLSLGQVLINLLNDATSEMRFQTGYDNTTIVFGLLMVIVVTALAGIYPALILSRFSPVKAIKNQISLSSGSGSFSLRKVLTLAQFFVASLLLIVTVIASSQMSYIRSKDLGFNTQNILMMHFSDKTKVDLDVIFQEIEALSFVDNVSRCMGPPQTGVNWNSSYNLKGEPTNDALKTNLRFVDENYLEVYGIHLMAGRNLENEVFPDDQQKILVNQEFVRRLGIEDNDAVGRTVQYNGNYEATISGVLQDYHLDKLNSPIRPAILAYQPNQMNNMNMQLAGEDLKTYLPILQQIQTKYDPEGAFDPKLLEDEIARSYLYEDMLQNSFRIFAILAVVIAIMGMYSLVSFMLEKNRKTIGIRKVFGASTNLILYRESKEYLVLISVGFVLSVPISFLIGQYWLDTFHYRIDISIFHYVFGFLLLIAFTASTVGYKSYLAASSNPVESLKYE